MSVRLLPGVLEGWWCVAGPKVAHLPNAAIENGALTTDARQALEARGFFTTPTNPYAVTVLTATSCNLGCAYCFQNTQASSNPYAPNRIEKSFLDHETAAKVQRFVAKRMAEHGFESVSLLLFGGEPLLNPHGCMAVLECLQPLGLDYADMISNAVLLKARLARRLYEAGLRRVQVTFDGARVDHDTVRVDHRGQGTFSSILDNIQASSDCTDLQWQFRINISHRNLDKLGELIDDLGRLNLPSTKAVRLALIDDVGIGYANALRYSDDLARTFIQIVTGIMDHGFDMPLLGGSLRDCPFCGCIGGASGAVINADGTLYSCWETAGRPEWSVGDIDSGYLPTKVMQDRWVACDYATASCGTLEQSRRFHDTIDAYILERKFGSAQRRETAKEVRAS